MDSEKGNRVFARGAQCAPPWFLEPKKSLVWIGLTQDTCRSTCIGNRTSAGPFFGRSTISHDPSMLLYGALLFNKTIA